MKNAITVLSREATVALMQSGFSDGTAVISFYDPPGEQLGHTCEPLDYTGICERVFAVAVRDIDIIEMLNDYGILYDTYLPEAPKLAKFIYSAVEDGLNIICQCEYGQSRSAACAAAIKEHFDKSGIEIFADYRYCPNRLLLNKLMPALEKEGLARSCLKGPFGVITDRGTVAAFPVSQTVDPVPSHREVWKFAGKSKRPWNYYPRGRVEIKRGKAVVYANPLCFAFGGLEGYLRFFFNLKDMPVEYKADNSKHYTAGVFEN